MTCIAAFKHPSGAVHLASDRQMTIGWTKADLLTPKIFQKGKFAYGVSGYARIGDILQHVFHEPPRMADQTTLSYLSGSWVNAWRQCLQDCGVKQITHNEDIQNSSVLMVYEGRIFMISSNFSVSESPKYMAIGSGNEAALGAFFAVCDYAPDTAAFIAVSAAIEHSVGCGGQIDQIKIE